MRVSRALATILTVPLLAAGLSSCGLRPERPNVVMIVLDTVRSDFTGTRAGGRDATPTLDRLAAEGANFVNAWATAPWTVPSHASLFTGALPSEHGCSIRRLRFDTELPTLAELLGSAGYQTAAFFSNPWLTDDATGLLRGFATREEVPYSGFMNRPLGLNGYQGGRNIVRNLTAWLGGRPKDRPFFVFVNLLEAHLPYDPPPDYRAAHLRDLRSDDKVTIDWGMEFNAGLHPTESVDWDRVRRLYAGDVSTADGLLAQVAALLEREGVDRNTVLVVTSDHGENLGEHDLIEHQFSVHETLLSVPLVIRAPGRLPTGVREEPVMLTDVFATILAFAGIEHPTPKQSRSLLAAPGAGSSEDRAGRPLFAEYEGPHPALVGLLRSVNPALETSRFESAYRTVRIGDMRLTVSDDGSVTLHDLSADPGQMRDIASGRPERVAELRRILDQALTIPGAAEGDEPELDPETKDKLRSLGYVN